MADKIHYKSTRGGAVTQQRLDDADAQHMRVVGDINKALSSVDDTLSRWGNWKAAACTSAYTAKPFDIVLADPSSAAFTVTLPDPSTCIGSWIQVKNDSASVNTITIQTSAAPHTGTIDGANTFSLAGARSRVRFASLKGPTTTEWKVF